MNSAKAAGGFSVAPLEKNAPEPNRALTEPRP